MISSPVFMISADQTQETTQIGLDAGADDFLNKPFSIPQLMSKVKNACAKAQHNWEISLGKGIQISYTSKIVFRSGDGIRLKDKDFACFVCLFDHRDRWLSHNEILEMLGGKRNKNYINQLVYNLRFELKKIRLEIKTSYRGGYQLVIND